MNRRPTFEQVRMRRRERDDARKSRRCPEDPPLWWLNHLRMVATVPPNLPIKGDAS